MKSRLCELFGIKYPIIQGALQWLALTGRNPWMRPRF